MRAWFSRVFGLGAKKQPQKAAEALSSKWVLEFICQAASSIEWQVAVQAFQSENTIYFDATVDENKFEYTEIHTKFHDLIEALLVSAVLDLGVTDAEMKNALSYLASCDILDSQIESNIEPLAHLLDLCHDFLAFRQFMINKPSVSPVEAAVVPMPSQKTQCGTSELGQQRQNGRNEQVEQTREHEGPKHLTNSAPDAFVAPVKPSDSAAPAVSSSASDQPVDQPTVKPTAPKRMNLQEMKQRGLALRAAAKGVKDIGAVATKEASMLPAPHAGVVANQEASADKLELIETVRALIRKPANSS